MSNPNSDYFVFRKNDDIGAAGAEDDDKYLAECFVDTGELEVLLDCENPRRVVVGRTGSGKTALLRQVLREQENVIELSPHSLSLNYIANNTVIRFFEESGVNLSPFYSLLWKHIFVVELLKERFNIRTEDSQRTCLERLRQFLSKDHIKEQAVDYLENWGNRFWLTTEERMRELTSRIETSLSTSLAGGSENLKLAADGKRNLSEEERQEVIQIGKKAVSEVQIRELENLISILDEAVFNDRKRRYYIVIDTLDEEWADDRIRFRLIKALIDTIRRFRKVANVEIVIALRQDLLDKVLHSSPDPGFQEEKYESLYLYVKWSPDQIRDLLTKRLNSLVRRKYTKKTIDIQELFPNSIDGSDPVEYITNRTFLRPRDAILFVNDCIAMADGKAAFTAKIIKKAEEEYSHKRLKSLATEWQLVHPNLGPVAEMFCGFPCHFPVSDLTREELCLRYEAIVDSIGDPTIDPMTIALNKLYREDGNLTSVRVTLVRSLHFVGLLGVKLGPTSTVNWVYESRLSLSPGKVRPSSTVHVHPMFHRALGVRV